MTEDEMVERCGKGERDAQRELYTRTVARIHRLLLKMTNNEDDAFDLTQGTYVRALTHIRQFDGRSSLQTWLYRIAVNEALRLLKRDKREREHLRSFARDRPDDDSAVDDAASRLDLDAALAALGTSDRAILLLRYQQGLDYRSIAEVIDCPKGTVASRLNRARKRLRTLLGRAYGEREESHARGYPTKGPDGAVDRSIEECRPLEKTREPGESP